MKTVFSKPWEKVATVLLISAVAWERRAELGPILLFAVVLCYLLMVLLNSLITRGRRHNR